MATFFEAKPDIPLPRRFALRLPEGSIRAILALLIVAAICLLMAMRPESRVPDYLGDLMFIILGHYFVARRRTTRALAEASGPSPLFLPRGTIRLLIIFGFVAAGAWLYHHQRLTALGQNPGVWTLVLAAGFLVGVVIGRIGDWLRDRGRKVPAFIEDTKAILALLAGVLLLLLVWHHITPLVSFKTESPLAPMRRMLGANAPERILSAIVGFYFGSRS